MIRGLNGSVSPMTSFTTNAFFSFDFLVENETYGDTEQEE